MDSINVSDLVERLGSDEDAVRKMAVFKLQCTYFRRSILPSSDQFGSFETYLGTSCPGDLFRGSQYPLT